MQQLCCGKTSKTTRPHVKIQKSPENEILEILRAGHNQYLRLRSSCGNIFCGKILVPVNDRVFAKNVSLFSAGLVNLLQNWGCANCSAQQQRCEAGMRWQACSDLADAGCAACPDLRLAKDSYAANEEWVESSADECASECREGFYNDTTQYAEGRCKRCWDRTELALHAGLEQQFFALFACNATSNARWAPCAQESGARIARTARLRVAAGVLRDHLPAAVAEHARAKQHRRDTCVLDAELGKVEEQNIWTRQF